VDPAATSLTVTISALNSGFPASLQGTLVLSGPNVTGNGTGVVSVTGSSAQIAADLAAGLAYTPPAGALASPFSPDLVQAGLEVSVSDGSVTAYASGNLISAPWIAWVSSDPTSTPDSPRREYTPPTITAPGSKVVAVGQPIKLNGFSVGNNNWLQSVTITVGSGTLELPAESGLTVTGNGTNQIQVTGTSPATYKDAGSSITIDVIPLASINAALSGLTYTPSSGYKGLDMLYFNASSPDFGATGTNSVGILNAPLVHQRRRQHRFQRADAG
jgi:hypothetical protein